MEGKDVKSCQIQQASELEILSQKSRFNIYHKSGVKQMIYLSNKVALAIKAVIGRQWTQHRLQQRFVREKVGVTCDGETKTRED